ncbi:hypothetical protein D9M72_378430 [compost metagenome]
MARALPGLHGELAQRPEGIQEQLADVVHQGFKQGRALQKLAKALDMPWEMLADQSEG